MKTLVVIHVFYPQFWPELRACADNVDGEKDLVITYVDEAAVAGARRDCPAARFFRCENRGYDVWPFLKALRSVDLAGYDTVVKLHTKRDVDSAIRYRFNHATFNGAAWREYLLAFVKTRAAWRRTRRLLARPRVGMVADRHVVMRRKDIPIPRTWPSFDKAAEWLGLPVEAARRRGQFVAGTMFAAKVEALRPLLAKPLAAGDFDPPAADHLTETFAHVMERALGLAVSKAGMRIVAFNGSLALRRAFFPVRKWFGW